MNKHGLKRVLGIFDLSAIGYGDLGSSIYYALGVTALYALGATPIALLLAGLVFLCTALTYAEMSAAFPDAGGSASFARQVFNDIVSFLAGWGLLLDYIVTIAISAFAVGPYLSYFFVSLKEPNTQIVFTIVLLLLLFLINTLGAKQSTRMSLILVGFTLFTQLIIILIGMLWLFDFDYIWTHMQINVQNVNWSPTWGEFWKGTAMAMVAYTGIESIAQLGAEAKKPEKTVPKAIMLVLVLLIFMYLGIAAVALSAISPHELGTTYVENPIEGIVSKLPFGKTFLGPWIALLAPAILLTAANAGLVGASRLSFKMGEYYQLPRFFHSLNKRFRTPYLALGFFAVSGAIIVCLSRGELSVLADLYNFGAMISFFSAHMSLIFCRIKKPDIERPFFIRLNIRFGKYSIPLSAILGALATFSVWVLVIITKPHARYLGFAWMVVGIIMYAFYRKKSGLPVGGQLKVEHINVPELHPVHIRHILVPTQEIGSVEAIQIACEFAKLHNAKVTFIHVIEVAYSLPLDTVYFKKTAFAQELLQRAEAISREVDITSDFQIVRARSMTQAILAMIVEKKIDLLVVGSLTKFDDPTTKGLPAMTEKLLKHSSCRVFLCSGSSPNISDR